VSSFSALSVNAKFAAVVVAVLLLLAALFPFARMYDERVDRARPMYADLETVTWLEYQQVHEAGASPAPLTITEDRPATINDVTFTPSRGTTVTVTPTGDGYCVTARDQDGDDAGPACWSTGSTPPLQPR
jgi:hypothetical protein